MMEVFRLGAAGGKSARSEGPYTGEIWRDVVLEGDTTVVANVFFTPCARTHWHTHPKGQLLIVVAGEGLIVDEDGPVHVTVGDMVWTPPNVRHWHGASAERSMMHTGVTYGGVEWAEEVSQADYEAACRATEQG
jgi:quercetin dioxygenase-like cupin family protein